MLLHQLLQSLQFPVAKCQDYISQKAMHPYFCDDSELLDAMQNDIMI